MTFGCHLRLFGGTLFPLPMTHKQGFVKSPELMIFACELLPPNGGFLHAETKKPPFGGSAGFRDMLYLQR